MTHKHSPGPWIIRESERHITVVSADNEAIFHDYKCRNVVADAHLIAAAPDMLEFIAE